MSTSLHSMTYLLKKKKKKTIFLKLILKKCVCFSCFF